ncbi:hypothetical protein DIPPA_04612 [Diplonema papillatum]|nr:hypothetical protein DIPPA_04612 [Diplonema papillatum]
MRQHLLLFLGLAARAMAQMPMCFMYRSESDCMNSGQCEWDQSAGFRGACVDVPCKYTDQALCEWDSSCEWDDACPDRVDWICVEKRCTANDQHTCQSDPRCEWSSRLQCTLAKCASYPTEKCCKHHSECEWNMVNSPASCTMGYCPQLYTTQSACDGDSSCTWANGQCASTSCNDLDECPCRNADGCFWDAAGSKKKCVDESFGKCPVLDVVLILDGSGSMASSFGRHPHGFYAMVEILRDWVHTIPLTGEKAQNCAMTSTACRSSDSTDAKSVASSASDSDETSGTRADTARSTIDSKGALKPRGFKRSVTLEHIQRFPAGIPPSQVLQDQMVKMTGMVATMRPKTPPAMPVDRTPINKKAPKTPVATPTKQRTGRVEAPSEDVHMTQPKRPLGTPGKSPPAKTKKAHQPASAKRS